MLFFPPNFSTFLHNLSISQRRFFLFFLDFLILPLSVWLSFWLRLATPFHPSFLSVAQWILPSVVLFGLPLFAFTGQYKGLTRYVGSRSLYLLSYRTALIVLFLVFFGLIFDLPLPPRSSWLLLWFLLTGFTASIRFIFRDLLLNLRSVQNKSPLRVAIYGAGQAGAQLLAALQLTSNHKVVSFIDDNSDYWNRSINGVPIHSPSWLFSTVSSIDQVLLAIPSLSRSERRVIVNKLQALNITVFQVPSVDDLTSGRARIDSLRPIAIEDLLGRDPVNVDPKLFSSSIRSSVICVTGAGGSIGSELCRQLIVLRPLRLILLERSEPSLYSIDQEPRQILPQEVSLLSVLGSCSDKYLLENLFKTHNVDIIYHAAAYKHVPLVEANPLAGLSNNVLSTRVVCESAVSANVSKVILISTDKAVRPTNVMGATKRLSELILQSFSEQSYKTCFAMVRFGNVLDSSGSVVPVFRRQVASGGPVTITHPDIIRYFMTIPEASQLVLQASYFAQGGEVFLLDMGEPVRIMDLAVQVILHSGLTVRDSSNPQGDIEIVCTGLRPGEKLYEELLIDAECQPTSHPLIYRAFERSHSAEFLWPRLDDLEMAIKQQDVNSAFTILSEIVPEWSHATNGKCCQ